MKQNLKQYILLIALIVTSVHNIWAATEHTPFIESLTGSISGNTLTLTATFNYDNISSMVSNIQYHWSKGGEEQSGSNNVFTLTDGAFVTEEVMWEVYATYTYTPQSGEPETRKTNVAEYLQTPPLVTISGSESGDNLTLTATFNTYGTLLTNAEYHWVTYTYNADGEVTAENDVIGEATKIVSSIAFEEKVWHAYVKYKKSGVDYQTSSARYAQQPKPLPTLSVTKVEDKEQGHDMLVMNASLSPIYTGVVPTYHWSKNGEEQSGNEAHREVPHAFDTQLWRCWATFTFDDKDYTTNDDTYTYYSTLGQLNFHADLQSDGTVIATLQDAASLHEGVTIAYSWKDSKGRTNGSGDGRTYTRTNDAAWVEFTATITQNGTSNQLIKYAHYSFDGEHTVVYINYTGGGSDSRDGLTPQTPVATWKKAYSLLNNGGWERNIIVIVNNGSTAKNMIITENDTQGKAATITGRWPWDNSALPDNTGRVYVNGNTSKDNTGTRIGAATRFKDVVFYGTNNSQNRLSCFLNDIEFDTRVEMRNFANLETNAGAIAGHTSPHFHLQLYADQLQKGDFPQAQNKIMNVTIKSGQFGRILASRIAGTKAKDTYIIGRHDNPFKINITVDIKDANNRKVGSKTYTDDIGYLASGLTQGMMWGDVTMNIKRGRIATLVAGSQGNALKMGDLKVPVSTYCGRSEINVMAENNEDVVIENYYGGCQGRVYGSEGVCDAYFYGKSTLNVTGGTIRSDIFASSAGISGLRSDDPDYYAKKWYTPDQRIPYPGSYAYSVDYLPYDRNKQIVTMTTHNGNIDLNDTEIKINISGGIVNNVYGGSYGNSDPLDNVNYAPAHAGRLFGNTSVNISGGTVTGNIYGGGKGSTRYYAMASTDAKRKDFLDVAQVYGNTNVTITGTPDIKGNIYGAGAGVDATNTEQFLEIAKVYGNTNVIFDANYTDDNPFKGNIYGGGAHGGVEGNTNVVIQKGVIIGNVFGGSQGQEGYSNKAKVVGTTKVVVGE